MANAEGHPLIYIDKDLAALNYPYLDSNLDFVGFWFDPRRASGSLVMEVALARDSEFRIISEELTPANPGIIYCKSTLEAAGAHRKYPVIRFAPGEEYSISLGFKQPKRPCLESFTNTRTYYVYKDKVGQLIIRFDGLKSFNPQELRPRDEEAATNYFDLNCLS